MLEIHLRTVARLVRFSLLGIFPLILAAAEPTTKIHQQKRLSWDSTVKEAKLNPGEISADIIFAVTNPTSEKVTIERADVSCGCTKVELPASPWQLQPGEYGKLKVHFDGTGKSGTIEKTILVYSSIETRVLSIRVQLPAPKDIVALSGERSSNQATALANRQAVFQGSCAECHATPTVSKKGKELFAAACGICHTAEHRASMVPDLKTLKADKTSAYWDNWIRNGKPNSLMPAFELKQNGILTDEQIKSLVEYLVSDFSTSPVSPAVTK